MIPAREVNRELKKCLEALPIDTTLDELITVYIIVLLEGYGGNRMRVAMEAGLDVRSVRKLIHHAQAKGYRIKEGEIGKRPRGPRSDKSKIK